MTTRRALTWTVALAAVVLALVTLWIRVTPRAMPESRTVVLSNGETVSGWLLPLNEPRFVLQTEKASWIVDIGDIRTVDGEPVSGSMPAGGDAVVVQETFEDVGPGGDIDVYSSMRHRNNGAEPVRELRWGMAPHEVDYIDSFRVLDRFGHSMPLEVVETRPDGGKRVKVTLARPLFPGEESWYTSYFRQSRTVFRDGDTWVYRNVGDYPGNRIVTRSVLLPAGAEVVSITPDPLHRDTVDGRELVVWRRFFMRGDRVPWEIRYRLD